MTINDFTESQNKIIIRIVSSGYVLKGITKIGRLAFVELAKTSKSVFTESVIRGSIGTRGRLQLWYLAFGESKKISSVYELGKLIGFSR